MSLGYRLKELRTRKKLTQQQLGDAIHVSKVSISGYENNTRTPDTETLQDIADYFNVSVDYLLGRTDKPNLKSYSDKTFETISKSYRKDNPVFNELFDSLSELSENEIAIVNDLVQSLIKLREG